MPETILAQNAVELAVVERSGFIESRHLGAAVAVDAEGKVLLALGDVQAPVFARSTLKPFQALASLQAGAPLYGAEVAIAAGSHTGSIEHQDLVRDILRKADLGEDSLLCPAAWPEDREAYQWMLRSNKTKAPVAMNCSGKHAGFLRACVESDWPLDSYLSPDHPLQRSVLQVISEYTKEKPSYLGVDGCGSPVVAVSLTGLAQAYSALAQAPENYYIGDARMATIATAMLDYPWAVAGRGKADTVVLDELGVIAKSGAEGLLALATADGTAVTVKILDGQERAAMLLGLFLLVAAGAISDAAAAAVLPNVVPPVLGGGQSVGQLRLSPAVTSLLPPA